jgi:copper chaperone CopZ
MKTATFPVLGMNCAGCARAIEKRLAAIQGIARAEASYVTQTVTLTYGEGTLTEAQVRGLVSDCGFACGNALPGAMTARATAS